jgi:hypothetical protein
MPGGTVKPRDMLVGYYAEPGQAQFKIMVRAARWN